MNKHLLRERIYRAHRYMLLTMYGLFVVFMVLHCLFILLGNDGDDGGRPKDNTPPSNVPDSFPREWSESYA